MLSNLFANSSINCEQQNSLFIKYSTAKLITNIFPFKEHPLAISSLATSLRSLIHNSSHTCQKCRKVYQSSKHGSLISQTISHPLSTIKPYISNVYNPTLDNKAPSNAPLMYFFRVIKNSSRMLLQNIRLYSNYI